MIRVRLLTGNKRGAVVDVPVATASILFSKGLAEPVKIEPERRIPRYETRHVGNR